ncbi:MAG: cupredoxin domain-containing protein [Chloroflexi bacterium]|nr:cupredoxin domain-containing protein [Chloroflexota bacterium]
MIKPDRLGTILLLLVLLHLPVVRVANAQTSPPVGVTEVEISSFVFKPASVTVAAGTTITWNNADPVAHTVTATDHSFDSGSIKNGQSYSRTFAQPGTFDYFCEPHPNMKGVVIVKSTDPIPTTPSPQMTVLPAAPLPPAPPEPVSPAEHSHMPEEIGPLPAPGPAPSADPLPSPGKILYPDTGNSLRALFGTITAADTDTVSIETQDEPQGKVMVQLYSRTDVVVPQSLRGPSIDLKTGDHIAVVAGMSEGKYVALQIAPVPGEPVSKHLHGLVVGSRDSSVVLLDRNGKVYLLQLSEDLVVPRLGQLIMASVEEDQALEPAFSGRILTYGVSENILERLEKQVRRIAGSKPKDEKEERIRAEDLEKLEGLLSGQADANLQLLERALEKAPFDARSIYLPVLNRAMEKKWDVAYQIERRKDRDLFVQMVQSLLLSRDSGTQQASSPISSRVPTPQPNPLPDTSPVLAIPDARVDISGYQFNPKTITITPGTTVVWTNLDPASHTVTSRDGSFDSGMMRTGQTFRRTFTQVGYFDYYCDPHPAMMGTIIVQYPNAPLSAQVPIPAPTPTPIPFPPANSANSVNISGFQFSPQALTVAAGTTVVWTNLDAVSHTVTANDGSFDSGLIGNGQSYSRTFTQAGSFTYRCGPHPTMTGVVMVQGWTATPTPPPPPTPSPTPTPPAQNPVTPPGDVIVNISGFAFNPPTVTIAAGATVAWQNLDPASHSVTANDRSFDSGLIGPGQTFTRVFTQVGTFTYHCEPHPTMTGKVIVQAGAPSPTPPAPTPTPAPSPSQPTIAIGSNAYAPFVLTVTVGTPVTWKNFDQARHTVTAFNKSFDSDDLKEGQSYTRTFAEAGTFDYYCKRHKGMIGRLVVQAAAPASSISAGAGPALGASPFSASPAPSPQTSPALAASPTILPATPSPGPDPRSTAASSSTPAPTPRPTSSPSPTSKHRRGEKSGKSRGS